MATITSQRSTHPEPAAIVGAAELSKRNAAATRAPGTSADGDTELWTELQELAAEAAEALGDGLVAVLLGGDYGRSEGTLPLRAGAQAVRDNVHLFLITTSAHPRGLEKLPHLARRYEHRLRTTVDFSRPITPAMISRWPPRLIWQQLALGHRVLYGPADILAARVPRHVLDPLPTIEATRLLLNSGAGLIGAARVAAGKDDTAAAADADLVNRLYYNCAQSMADALLIGCQRFSTDPCRKQIHLMDIARFEPIVDQSGAVVHLRRASQFNRSSLGEFTITAHHLQEMAQDWERVFLWIESVRLGLRFQNLERYAAWPGRRDVPGTSWLGGIFANLRRGRLGWTHPTERVYRMLAVAISDLAHHKNRFPFTADAALQEWREAK